jgi:hypothetical protein
MANSLAQFSRAQAGFGFDDADAIGRCARPARRTAVAATTPKPVHGNVLSLVRGIAQRVRVPVTLLVKTVVVGFTEPSKVKLHFSFLWTPVPPVHLPLPV